MNLPRKTSLIGSLLVAVCFASGARGDYYATRINFVTGTTSGIVRLDETTGEPVPGFNFVPASSTQFFPASIALGPDNFLYVSDAISGEITRVDPVTGASSAFGQLPPIPIGGGQFFDNPAGGLRFGPDGNLFVASRGVDAVFEYDGATGATQPIGVTFFAQGTVTSGINFTSDGELLVTGFQSGSVYAVDSAGQVREIIPSQIEPGTTAFSTPTAVLPTDDGRYWVTDVFANSLRLYENNGLASGPGFQIPPLPLPDPDNLPPGATSATNSPAEIAFDDEGNILLATLGLSPLLGGDLFRVERPQGDFNGDMLVDARDYTVWRDNYGTAPAPGHYDGNGDGIYDTADYAVWRDSLGSSASFTTIRHEDGAGFSSILQFTPAVPALHSSTSVPEPTTCALMLLASLGGTMIVRRTH